MLKIYKRAIGAALFILVASGIGYFIMYDGAPMRAMLMIAVTSVPIILLIRIFIVSDKGERLEKSKELQMHRLIYAAIDGVVEIQKQPGNHTYKVYTDTDVYMVEYGKAASKIIHVGEYQRIDSEG